MHVGQRAIKSRITGDQLQVAEFCSGYVANLFHRGEHGQHFGAVERAGCDIGFHERANRRGLDVLIGPGQRGMIERGHAGGRDRQRVARAAEVHVSIVRQSDIVVAGARVDCHADIQRDLPFDRGTC